MQLSQYLLKILVIIIVLYTCTNTNTIHAETTVINNISVSSNSGGNVAKNGEVVEGKSKSSANITTVVNGEIVEDIHKTSNTGYVHIEHTTVSSRTGATTSTHLDMQNMSDNDASVYKSNNNDAINTKKASTTIISNTDNGEHVETNISLFKQATTSIFKKIMYALSKLFKFQ